MSLLIRRARQSLTAILNRRMEIPILGLAVLSAVFQGLLQPLHPARSESCADRRRRASICPAFTCNWSDELDPVAADVHRPDAGQRLKRLGHASALLGDNEAARTGAGAAGLAVPLAGAAAARAGRRTDGEGQEPVTTLDRAEAVFGSRNTAEISRERTSSRTPDTTPTSSLDYLRPAKNQFDCMETILRLRTRRVCDAGITTA